MFISLPLKCEYLLLLLLQFFFAATVSSLSDIDSTSYSTSISNITSSTTQSILLVCRRLAAQIDTIGISRSMQIAAICACTIPAFFYIRRKSRSESSGDSAQWQPISSKPSGETDRQMDKGSKDATDAISTDPGLLRKHSEYRTYSTTRFTYESIRIFYRRHPQADMLPTEPAPLPLLVFMHGLGGSAAQFGALLTSLVNLASCLCIDLPGCGLSKFSEKSWEAYTSEALAELLAQIIEDYRDKENGQSVVLIAHSMGSSLAALLASTTSPLKHKLSNVVGVVAICPKADPPTEAQVATFRKLLLIPGVIFDLWRRWDRRGGPESASVRRFVGENAEHTVKVLQERFNSQSRTPVWRRMASGVLPNYRDGVAIGGIPGKDVWAGIAVPIFLIGGESDHVTKPEEIDKIANFLGKSHPIRNGTDENSLPVMKSSTPFVVAEQHPTASDEPASGSQELSSESALCADSETTLHDDPFTPTEGTGHLSIPFQPIIPRKVLKTTVLPSPAGHALLYTPATVRILAGLISDFLCSQVSTRLSLGWQLQFLSTTAKWDVKNLNKWKSVAPVSDPIAGIFRAMKTLREVDESHCPEVFVQHWGSQIKDIVDISHEQPVYDPRGLEKGGTRYHKFPTVSKIPPTNSEVEEFIALVDRLRAEQKVRAEEENWAKDYYIGVHCHYGFNRTGYFIVCYLVERCGFSVQGAVDEFAKRRPKGIKHAHFLDQLFVKYCVGLKRAPTL